MNVFKNTRLIFPALVVLMGIFNLLNTNTGAVMKTFWWFLTPFALIVGIARAWLLYRHKKTGED